MPDKDELYRHSASFVLQVEKLLAEVDALDTQQGNDNLTPEALDNRTRLYERVASEVSRLKYFLAKGHQLPSLQQLQPRADSAVERLSVLLRQALDAALRGGHQSAALHCLQAYAAVGDTQGAEEVRHLSYSCEMLIMRCTGQMVSAKALTRQQACQRGMSTHVVCMYAPRRWQTLP